MAASPRVRAGGKAAAAIALLAAAAALGACAQLGTQAPSDFDLSGEWVLDRQASDAAPDIDAIRDREDRQLVRGKPANAADSAAFVVQDFPVLAARRLRIEQHADSMGVYYDGHQYRDVSWATAAGICGRCAPVGRLAGWWSAPSAARSAARRPSRLENGGRRLRIAVSVHAGADTCAPCASTAVLDAQRTPAPQSRNPTLDW